MKVGSLVVSDQLLQLSTLLPSHYVYGLGERDGPLLASTKWTRYTMWNFDRPPSPQVNEKHIKLILNLDFLKLVTILNLV